MPSNFKETLIRESGLLSLSQSDCDLYLIGQARTITYRQLAITELHGKTVTGGRLSIKKLERDNYVTSRTLPGSGREKYYMLTAKGKNAWKNCSVKASCKKCSSSWTKRLP